MADNETTVIIKRKGQRPTETFNRDKLHQSIVAASLSARAPEGQADTIAYAVTNYVLEWLESRPEVTSHDIRLVATRHLRAHHPDAAYLYEQHRTTL
ncbi:MAG TPA: ATP cone domain-containing protein [Candidatus Microsaccharimonas sp.]|jgi:transcriptional regulator NrdR family protein